MVGADFLQLDPAQARPGSLTAWLAEAVRGAVADGRLAPGDRLPATRVLADQLGCSRGVVVDAYRRLTDEGLLSGRHGGGTTVRSAWAPSSDSLARLAGPGARPADPGAQPAGARTRPASTGVRPAGVVGHAAPSGMASAMPPDLTGPDTSATNLIDLSPGLPDLSAFPRAAWARAERAALSGLASSELGYGDPRGLPALREALAGWLARTRGLRAHPDDILVVTGVSQGLMLLARALSLRGASRIGFEDPGSFGAREHLRRWDLEPVPVRVDQDGLDVEALASTGLDAVLVTPAHQFPTGVVLAPDRRRALIAWARAGPPSGPGGLPGRLVIEDDYDAEHRYDRPPVPALRALAPDHVVHLGSVSKTLAPAIRIGWLLAPAALQSELVEARYWTDLASPALPQLALAHFITSGGFERHLRQVRRRHRARRDALLTALAAHLPGGTAHGVAAGLHLLVTLPGVDDAAVARRAAEAGVRVHPLSAHRVGDGPPGLVIGYAANTPDRLHEAVRRIAGIVNPAPVATAR
ncbi:GntR family transcriptional regulator/MocR family aminotransferase [Promicromonospora sp. AC04]|uniref:MocR-like pyridoxine biosynthesis transcription factor PdxR n=1 Tax=Promicromonospora sp. AC04 TaxID=2135723 RepID=UPI000D3CEC2F|nr:PLP-dependent aminotransferase family protein [Promicromonospora sp. AC04]PUB29721.1 GntR family transcriptional regulator/MocR family aminotransferase [Promicromonospora sp. AC04]